MSLCVGMDTSAKPNHQQMLCVGASMQNTSEDGGCGGAVRGWGSFQEGICMYPRPANAEGLGRADDGAPRCGAGLDTFSFKDPVEIGSAASVAGR